MAENQNTNGEISQVNNTVQPINGTVQTPMPAQTNVAQNTTQNVTPTVEAKEKKPKKIKKSKIDESMLIEIKIDPDGPDAVKSDKKQAYRYLARNKEGVLVKDYFSAHSKYDVYSYLVDQGMTVYNIETNSMINFFRKEAPVGSVKMKIKDLIFWLTQLSTYIKAGIPLADAVKILAQQDKRKKYKPIYDSLIYELTMGESFSDALGKQGAAFPQLLVNMIKSAEMIGKIEDTLDEMADYYQDIEDTKKAVISAITYPSIVLIFAIAVITFMLVYIIPKFKDVFVSMGAEIPKITQFALNLSAFLTNNYIYIISAIIIFVVVFIFSYKKIKSFKVLIQKFNMRLPVIGKLIIAKEMSMFASTFATLTKNSVMLTDCMEILSKITSNEIYKDIMNRTMDNLIKGDKMSETFKDNWAIPDLAFYMILTGENTGELGNMLEKVGEYYLKEEKNLVGQIKTFIEPAMILFLAVAVGFIVISDQIKDDAKTAVKNLKKTGVSKIVMLTGDSGKAAEKAASQLGITEVFSELLPQDKVSKIEILLEELKNSNGKVAFAGDGINDAPVLARADVGIAMGALGSDAAIESADVVIMTDEPSKVADSIKISKKTMSIVRQNIVFSIGIKVLIMLASGIGIGSMWLAVFGDVGVSFLAVLNSMRALGCTGLRKTRRQATSERQ